MTTVTIWHNPRCSKSGAALAILEEHGVTPQSSGTSKRRQVKSDIITVLTALAVEAKHC